MLTLVLLAVLAVGALFFLIGGGSVRTWVIDVGQSAGVIEGVPEQTRRGIAAYRAGDRARAEQEFAESARTYRRSALALLYLATMRLDAGDLAGAEAHLREAAAREPDSPLVHRELGDYFLARARQAAASGGPGSAEVRAEVAGAEEHYARALALNPGDAEARAAYGCVLAALDRVDESDAALAEAGARARCARIVPALAP